MKYYTQQELCNAVFQAVATSPEPISRLEICEKIGRKKGPHIIAMIEHLVDTGYFAKGMGETKFKKAVLLYWPTNTAQAAGACSTL